MKLKRVPRLKKDRFGEYYEVDLANKKGVTLIDRADWALFAGNFYRSVDGYACQTVKVGGKNKQVYLHKQIVPSTGPVGHADGNYANNRRHNLRKCTTNQNQWNRKKDPKRWSSKFKGVVYVARKKDPKKWKAVCWQFGEPNFLGYFKTERAAAKAYDAEAKKRFGEFARCNL